MTIKFYALFNKQYEYDFILKNKRMKNKEAKGSIRALLFTIYSLATNFPKNIGNIFKI